VQFTNTVENYTVFCKCNELTKGDVQQVLACMNTVCLTGPRGQEEGRGQRGGWTFALWWCCVIWSAHWIGLLWLLLIQNT